MARAVLFHGPDRPLEMARLPTPTPRGAEVLVRVTCCTLCSSDLHTHAGRRTVATPTVLGHEIVGSIEAFGPRAARRDFRGAGLAVGDRVSWSVAASCGGCFFCADGLPQKCAALFKYGHERVQPEQPFAGGLADYVLLVPGTAVFRVPDGLSDALAAPANCATATVAAVLRTAGAVAGRSVLIFGAGMLGLTACALARANGAASVLVSDPDAARRARALAFGATQAFAPEELAARVADATRGRGADVTLELAGVAAAVAAGLALTRVGGALVLAGTVLPTPSVPLDPEAVVRRMLTIRGVHNYAPGDLATALDFLAGAGKAYPFAELVSRTFRLDDAEQAIACAHAHPGGRVAVVPGCETKMQTKAVDAILKMFSVAGEAAYYGEAVSQTEHALQSAHLAASAGADDELIVAALLHDIGHLLRGLPEDVAQHGIDDTHEEAGAHWLEQHFGPAVSAPVRLHVAAKRYLCAVDATYLAGLSPASQLSLRLQGGPFTTDEARAFERQAHFAAAVALRRWDDGAKVPGLEVPALAIYRRALESALERGGKMR
jgi:alcohol dehydrogenase